MPPERENFRGCPPEQPQWILFNGPKDKVPLSSFKNTGFAQNAAALSANPAKSQIPLPSTCAPKRPARASGNAPPVQFSPGLPPPPVFPAGRILEFIRKGLVDRADRRRKIVALNADDDVHLGGALIEKDSVLFSDVLYIEEERLDEYGSEEAAAALGNIRRAFQSATVMMDEVSPEVMLFILTNTDLGTVEDYIAANFPFRFKEKQELL